MIELLIGIFSIIIAAIVVHRKTSERYKLIEQLPGPKGLPIIGNAHQIGLNPYDFLKNLLNWWNEYDRGIFRFWIGKDANIVISNPSDVEAVLSSTVLLKKSSLYDLLHPWLGQGLLTSFGPKWHKHRKMITPSFHFKILVDFLDVMEKSSDTFMKKLSEKASQSKIFDIQDMIHYLTLDVICDTAMGVNINAMENRDSELVKAFQTLCFVIQLRAFRILKRNNFLFRFAKEYKEYTRALQVLTEFTSGVIEKRRKLIESEEKDADNSENIKVKRAFLDTLLTATIDNQPLTFQDIFEEVSTFMFEGHDTTTSGIAFTIFLLSRHPKIQRKVLEEQQSILGGDLKRQATFQEIQEMKYLEMVIKESLRMYPSVPLIGRDPIENFNLNGKIIPPHSTIMLFILAMGYDESIYPDPYKFDPERFNHDKQKTSVYEYVPFSAGPRNCIGQKFAMLELKSIISKVVRHFEILPAKDDLISKDGYQHWEQSEYDPKLSAVLTLKSENGIQIRLRARNS